MTVDQTAQPRTDLIRSLGQRRALVPVAARTVAKPHVILLHDCDRVNNGKAIGMGGAHQEREFAATLLVGNARPASIACRNRHIPLI